jgi:hypothetical protein
VSKDTEGDEVDRDELDDHEAEELPARELMSKLGGPIAIPLDPAIAADVLSGDTPEDADDSDETEGGTNGEEA